MIRIYSLNDLDKIRRNCACIGFFDGVHLGHQELIKKTVEESKKKNLIPSCITFKSSEFSKNNLVSFNRKIELLSEYGIEDIILLPFNEDIKNTTPEDFVSKYLNNFNIDTLICGFDFTYGYMAKGNINTLRDDKRRNFEVIEVPEFQINGIKVSSTYIRKLLNENDYETAYKLLGHKL